jgi:hypothetical protein
VIGSWCLNATCELDSVQDLEEYLPLDGVVEVDVVLPRLSHRVLA